MSGDIKTANDESSEILRENMAQATSYAETKIRNGTADESTRGLLISLKFSELNFRSAMTRTEAIAKRQADSPKYKGWFNKTEIYERGDCVTHGGSAFFCVRDGVSSAPSHEVTDEVSPDWQIMVKRGRDARGDSR